MLYGTVVTLLIASIGISRIQAKAIGEERAQLNQTQTPVDGVNSVIEASTVQKNSIFNTGPNDENIYGSIVKVENNKYESPDSRQPTSTQTHTLTAPGGPGHDGVSYVKSEEGDHQGQPKNRLSSITYSEGNIFDVPPGDKNLFGSYIEQKTNVYISRGDNNQTQPNEKHVSSNGGNIGLSAITRLTNNVFRSDGGVQINAGAKVSYNGNVYISDKNSQTENKTINDTERQNNSSALITKISGFMPDRRKKYDDWQNKLIFGKQSPTKSKAHSSFTIHDSFLSSQIEKNAQDNEEKEANADKHSKPNGQTSLSSNLFNSFTYFLIILIKSSVLN